MGMLNFRIPSMFCMPKTKIERTVARLDQKSDACQREGRARNALPPVAGIA
jgi:hypothetical protein